MENYVSIGYTKKTRGVKGDLKVEVGKGFLADFKKSSVVFLSIQGKEMPYFVEKIREEKELLLKLEDVDSKEIAHDLTSKEMFLRASDVSNEPIEEEEDELVFEYLIGFEIEDNTYGKIGKILDVVEYPQQEIAIIMYNDFETLIPLHEQLIKNIDESKKILFMDLPEGLLEI